MNTSKVAKPVLRVELFLENTSERKGKELNRRIGRNLPGYDVRNHHLYRMHFAGGSREALEIVHEILVFIHAHKVDWVAAGAYPAKKAVDIIADTVKEWAKVRFKKRTHRFYLYGPDGKPVKAFEIHGGKEKRVAGRWREYARKSWNDFKKRM